MADKLGKYIIEHEIGRGGMGIVYKGRDPDTNEAVAIKVLPANLASDPTFLARFRREAATLQHFEHPGIVKMIDQGKEREAWYYVMEYVDGDTLDARLKGGPLEPREVVDLALQISPALEYAHEQGIIHRDIKPANIMLTKDGRAKLTDFGIAKLVDATRMTATESILGTVEYMSPEQSQGRFVDPRTDIYSLGVVLYRCVTGRLPITGENPTATLLNLRTQQIEKPINWRPEIPEYLSDLIMKMLEKEPSSRIPSARALTRELERVAQRLVAEAEPEKAEKSADRIIRSSAGRTRALPVSPGMIAGIIALVVIAATLFLLARSADPATRLEEARRLADSTSSADRSRVARMLEKLAGDEGDSEIGLEAAELLASLREESGQIAMARQILLAANFAERRGYPALAFDLLELVLKYHSGTQQAEEAAAHMERLRERLEVESGAPDQADYETGD